MEFISKMILNDDSYRLMIVTGVSVSIKSKSVMKSEDASARVKRRKRCERTKVCRSYVDVRISYSSCFKGGGGDSYSSSDYEESKWHTRGMFASVGAAT